MFFDDKEFIAKKIKKFRKLANMTQAELAEKIGVNEKHISHIENGKYIPSLSTFFKIIETLDINLEEFGINQIAGVHNQYRQNLIKIIYSASNKELKLYHDVISTIENEIPELKYEKL